MPSEFKVKNGLIVDQGGAQVTGSLEVIVNNNLELQVLSTGVRLGNAITDTHNISGRSRMTGSLILSGSINARETGLTLSGIFTGNTLGGIAMTTDSSAGYSFFTSGGTLQIYDNTNAATRFYMDGSGNLGIGTSSPSAKLNVKGTVRIEDQTGTPASPATPGTPSNGYGVDVTKYLGEPSVWLKITVDGADYYFPGYE